MIFEETRKILREFFLSIALKESVVVPQEYWCEQINRTLFSIFDFRSCEIFCGSTILIDTQCPVVMGRDSKHKTGPHCWLP